uniref:Uncharacterized protein n=1 Tax=Arundo donax TaxID=35708 RepID=A0A0A9AE43_ARUDO
MCGCFSACVFSVVSAQLYHHQFPSLPGVLACCCPWAADRILDELLIVGGGWWSCGAGSLLMSACWCHAFFCLHFSLLGHICNSACCLEGHCCCLLVLSLGSVFISAASIQICCTPCVLLRPSQSVPMQVHLVRQSCACPAS